MEVHESPAHFPRPASASSSVLLEAPPDLTSRMCATVVRLTAPEASVCFDVRTHLLGRTIWESNGVPCASLPRGWRC
jgi:hypothetical protein